MSALIMIETEAIEDLSPDFSYSERAINWQVIN
jgi:hypothetical protein